MGQAVLRKTRVCSLIVRSAGTIIGHIGMCHRQFIVTGDGATPLSTMHAIDWRGSHAHSGLGAFLMLEALATSKIQYANGSSEQAQVRLSKVGLRAEAQGRRLSQGARTIPSLAYNGSGIISQMRRNSQGHGVRLASAHTAGAADRRTALGTYVHRRN